MGTVRISKKPESGDFLWVGNKPLLMSETTLEAIERAMAGRAVEPMSEIQSEAKPEIPFANPNSTFINMGPVPITSSQNQEPIGNPTEAPADLTMPVQDIMKDTTIPVEDSGVEAAIDAQMKATPETPEATIPVLETPQAFEASYERTENVTQPVMPTAVDPHVSLITKIEAQRTDESNTTDQIAADLSELRKIANNILNLIDRLEEKNKALKSASNLGFDDLSRTTEGIRQNLINDNSAVLGAIQNGVGTLYGNNISSQRGI